MTSSLTTAEHTARLVLRHDQQKGRRQRSTPPAPLHALAAHRFHLRHRQDPHRAACAGKLGVRHLAVAVPSLDLVHSARRPPAQISAASR